MIVTRDERRQMWKERVAAWEASGQSVHTWCLENDVSTGRMYHWCRKFRNVGNVVGDSSPQWIPVGINESSLPLSGGLVIRVGRAEIELQPGFDQKLLADVMRTLIVL